MLKAIVAGAGGRMGQRIINVINNTDDIELASAFERKGHALIGKDIGTALGLGKTNIMVADSLKEVTTNGEVIIDFTTPTASLDNLKIASENKKAMVIGTTGFSPEQKEEIKSLTQNIPCVLAPNMSVGVNLMFKIIEQTAKVLGEEYDVEIVETHHRFKKDAPSGTAMKMAEILAKVLNQDLKEAGIYGRKGIIGERTKKEIGIHAVRAGDVIGEHTVTFGGLGERVEITHKAHTRDNFARGAVRAAKWVVSQKPGLYDMLDVLNL